MFPTDFSSRFAHLPTDAVNIFLIKVDHFINSSITKIKMNRLCTNTSREGTKDSLTTKINKLRRTIDLDLFLVIICSLHSINLMICSCYEKCFGNGSVSSRNAIQMLYICYIL